MGPTPEQRDLAETIGRVLAGDPGVEAAWLGGSLGRGAGDAWSDVDVVALVPQGEAAAASARVAELIPEIAEPVLVNRLFGGRVLNVVTADWRRFDISLVEPAELARFDAANLEALFNKGELGPPRGAPQPYAPAPETVLALVNEFLRVLGLLVVAAGREEWMLAQTGTEILRRLTMDLMLEENAVGPVERGGALRRNPHLTAEQRAELEGLSPVAANRESLLAANAELARVFLPRAKRLAERIGMAWPAAFEAATRRHLAERLRLTFD